ncbi:hypothetical protein SETIT_5G114100v2 [Setaria italica]|uniref:Leucine-rich repeat-containing N-terminal plant-type domain-containing protein n=1 Tax=Setaria italica TaxID=4555 RepID=A0A368R3K9_SETIT|nr:hypothetical protein SETIT_5G114100v2 [Setaria italica]
MDNYNFPEPIPTWISNLMNLKFLSLYDDNFYGPIPPWISNLTQLSVIVFSRNDLTGELPQTNMRNIASISNSKITNTETGSKRVLNGDIPPSSCSARRLEILNLSYNNFGGMIPSCLIQDNSRILKLRGNRIHGILNNQITGSFPSWLGVLPKLKVLVLRSNQFFGMITDLQENGQIINNFSSLHILDLASNSIIGHLPQGWLIELKSMMANNNDDGQIVGHQTNMSQGFYRDTVTITFKGFDIIFTKILTTFKVIDLSNNSFDGLIPESVGRLSSLHGLNMSHNNFTEQIPSQLGNLTRLESLDLSWNHLSGNPDLCGSQVPKQCDNPGSTTTPRASDHPESNSLWQDRTEAILLFTFVGLGFGVGFALAIMFLHFCRIDGWSRKCFCIHM